MNYKSVDVQGAQSALETIRASEAQVRDALNEWGPRIIEGVLAGDNIVHLNNLLGCFTGVRRGRLTSVVRKMVPYQFDAEGGVFTKKIEARKGAEIKRKLDAFDAFIAGNDTLYGLMEQVKKAEKKPVDRLRQFEKAASNALEDGIAVDDLFSILRVLVLKEVRKEPAQEAPEKEADAA